MPGMRVTSVRRTVRVAVALVTGQALLCGIIGFVTFDSDEPASRPGASAPLLAGPPIAAPATSVPPPTERAKRAEPGTARSTRTERPASPPASAGVRTSATRKVKPSLEVRIPRKPVPSTSPPDRELLLPPPSPAPADDAPVPVVQEPCDDEGATGRTAGGQAVTCRRDRRGELRWTLV